MMQSLADLHPVVQALLATLFTWGVTALGAACVFLAREMSRRTLDLMLGFAAGAMFQASLEEGKRQGFQLDMRHDMP